MKSDGMKAYKFTESAVLSGTVIRITDFGVVVTLPDGHAGIIHFNENELGNRSKKDLATLSIGDKITVRIIRIQSELDRISLVPHPNYLSDVQRFAIHHKVGWRTTGTLKKLLKNSAIVELEYGAMGFVRYRPDKSHITMNELRALSPGEKVSVLIASIDKKSDQILLCLLPESGSEENANADSNNPSDSPSLSTPPAAASGSPAVRRRP